MAKTQISTSVPPRTLEQYKELVTVYGTGSAVLTVAIDRLYQAERPSDAQRLRAGATNVPCVNCDRIINPASGWIAGLYDEAYCPECQE